MAKHDEVFRHRLALVGNDESLRERGGLTRRRFHEMHVIQIRSSPCGRGLSGHRTSGERAAADGKTHDKRSHLLLLSSDARANECGARLGAIEIASLVELIGFSTLAYHG